MKVLSLVICGLMLVGSAQAAEKKHQRSGYDSAPAYRAAKSSGGHRMAGCGLGSLAIEDPSKWAQVGAAFLNGTGVQTFGITFGTSNCTEDGVATASREKDAFIESNLADLRRDISMGNGAYMSSLASLYGCRGEDALSFGSALYKNRDKVLKSSTQDASKVIDEVVVAEGASCQG